MYRSLPWRSSKEEEAVKDFDAEHLKTETPTFFNFQLGEKFSKSSIKNIFDMILYSTASIDEIEWWKSNIKVVCKSLSKEEKAIELNTHFIKLKNKVENHAFKMLVSSEKTKDTLDYFLCYFHGTHAKKYISDLDWILDLASKNQRKELILSHYMKDEYLINLIRRIQDQAFIQFSNLYDPILYQVAYWIVKMVQESMDLDLKIRFNIVQLWLPFFFELSTRRPDFKIHNLSGEEIMQSILKLLSTLP